MNDTIALSPAQRKWLDEQTRERLDTTVRADHAKEEIKHEQKFEDLVQKAEKPLFAVQTVWPFDFFPDYISVDVSKVNFIHRSLFSKRVQSIYIRNISDVVVRTGIFFASISIVDFGFNGNSIRINFIKNSEALRLRKVIQGLVVSVKENIDLMQFDASEFNKKIELLGEARGVE